MYAMQSLRGKVAFITGAASGIGLGISRALAAAGTHIALTYWRDDQLQPALAELRDFSSSHIHPIRLDVSDRTAVAAATDEALRIFGKIHVVCNAAGVNLFRPMDEATLEDWDWVLGVNLQGTINVLVSTLPHVKAHSEGGHVINVGSMASFISGPSAGLYTTSKFAVRGLSESLRYALAPHGIGVSLVCPGLTRTNIAESLQHRARPAASPARPEDPAMLERIRRVHAAGMDPQEVGRKVVEAAIRNDFYVFTHPEFQDELREDAAEVIAHVPSGTAPPERDAVERGRRSAKADARAVTQRLTQTRYRGMPH